MCQLPCNIKIYQRGNPPKQLKFTDQIHKSWQDGLSEKSDLICSTVTERFNIH